MTRPDVVIRPIPTVVLGAVAGLMVGLTSVGAGLDRRRRPAVPVPARSRPRRWWAPTSPRRSRSSPPPRSATSCSAASRSRSRRRCCVGAIPGAWIGARISSRAPGGLIRRVARDPAAGVRASSCSACPTRAGHRACALVALLFAFFGWRLVRRARLKPRARPRGRPRRSACALPDLGAVRRRPGRGSSAVPERDTRSTP